MPDQPLSFSIIVWMTYLLGPVARNLFGIQWSNEPEVIAAALASYVSGDGLGQGGRNFLLQKEQGTPKASLDERKWEEVWADIVVQKLGLEEEVSGLEKR